MHMTQLELRMFTGLPVNLPVNIFYQFFIKKYLPTKKKFVKFSKFLDENGGEIVA